MKIKNVAITVLLFQFYLLSPAQKIITYQSDQFIFKINIDSVASSDKVNYDCSVKSIVIVSKKDGHEIQTISPGENSFYCDMDTTKLFVVEDVNFDGYPDIRLMELLSASADIPYYYYTFDSLKKQFLIDTGLSKISSPEFDHRNKLIKTTWKSGCCDHGKSTYKYINRKPILIEEVETKMDPKNNDRYITTVKKRINGQLKLTKTTISKEDN